MLLKRKKTDLLDTAFPRGKESLLLEHNRCFHTRVKRTTHSLTPSIPCVNLTSNCNCLGLIPRVWIPLLQTHSPARQILGKVFFHSPGAESCKVKSGFPDFFFFFFFFFPILTEEIKKRRAEGPGSLQSEPAPARPAESRAPAGNAGRSPDARSPGGAVTAPRSPGTGAGRGAGSGASAAASVHTAKETINKRAAQLSDSGQMLLPHVQARYSPTGASPRAGTPVDNGTPLRHTRAHALLWEKGSVSPGRSHPHKPRGVGVGWGRDGAQPPNSQGGQDTARTGPRGATLGDPQTLRAPHSRSDQNPYDRRSTQLPSVRHREPVTPWR